MYVRFDTRKKHDEHLVEERCSSYKSHHLHHEPLRKGSLKAVAFGAVVFSTVAVTACLITFPLVFQYVQTLQATVQAEVEFCKVRP